MHTLLTLPVNKIYAFLSDEYPRLLLVEHLTYVSQFVLFFVPRSIHAIINKFSCDKALLHHDSTIFQINQEMLVRFLLCILVLSVSEAFVARKVSQYLHPNALISLTLKAVSSKDITGLTPLPPDISPFSKSNSKQRDVQTDFRKIASKSLQQALQNGITQLELEFPPLLGGDQSKSQFDDFDNVQELNKNRDWCIQWLPSLSTKPVWFILPDLKEVELAKEEWGGQRYRQAAQFTSIEAVTNAYAAKDSRSSTSYSKPWGATFASGMSSLLGGGNSDSGLLGDQSSLDLLDQENPAKLHLVCQPGNGGPVEDWVNVKAFHEAAGSTTPTCIVNGALDKVRDGYYPGLIFPKLATTFDFYRSFEAIFFLKPISDKGVYGWLFRVYPEPWQVVLQTPKRDQNQVVIEDTVVLVSQSRPGYQDCVQALLSMGK